MGAKSTGFADVGGYVNHPFLVLAFNQNRTTPGLDDGFSVTATS